MTLNFKNIVIASTVAAICGFVFWLWQVLHVVQNNISLFQAMPYLIEHAVDHPALRPITIKVAGIFFGAFLISIYLVWSDRAKKTIYRVISGARIIEHDVAKKLTREDKFGYWLDGMKATFFGVSHPQHQIEIAEVPMPKKVESVHTLLAGSTGSGKSVAQDEMMLTALKRSDRMIVVDPNGHALSRFSKKGDVILNPFDIRSKNWSPFNEINGPQDFNMIAKAMIPDASSASEQAWHGYARTLLSACLEYLCVTSNMNISALINMATIMPVQQLAIELGGTSVSGMFQPGAEKALASSRFILTEFLTPYSNLENGEFSLRDWLENDTGNLYINWQESELTTLKPLVTTWLEILITSKLSSKQSIVPLWLFVDELGSLERMSSLESGLTKARKYGLRIVAGIQNISQLQDIYGKEAASTLRQCFRNILVLGGSNSDHSTAEELSKGLGSSEVECFETTYTHSQSGTTSTRARRVENRSAVTATQIMQLDPNNGYLKFSGDYPIMKIRLKPRDYRERRTAFKAKN